MDYVTIYDKLICRAQHRIINGYTEKHHIVPKCLGGNNDPANLAALTPEEHYLAHLLLVKMHPGNRKILHAAKMMSGQGNNKKYGWVKRRISSAGFSDEHRANMSKAHLARPPETLVEMHARWERNAKKREEKKNNAIITALIYAIS